MTLPHETLHDAIRCHAQERPTHPALIHGSDGRITSYQELADRIERLAGAISSRGVGPGDWVVLVGERSPVLVEAILAVARLGAVGLPIVQRSVLGMTLQVVREMVQPRLLIDCSSSAPEKSWHGQTWCRRAEFDHIAGSVSLPPMPTSDAPLYVNTTSASTGPPKLIVATQGQIVANTRACLEVLDCKANDVHLSTMAFHAHELFARALYSGATAVLLPDATDPGRLLEALVRHRVTHLMSNVVVYGLLEQVARGSIGSGLDLRVAEAGGMPMSERLSQRMVGTLGVPITPVWGSTESSGVAIAPTKGATRPYRSVGRALPGYVLQVQQDNGPLAAHGEGELIVSGAAVASGYVSVVSPQTALASGSFRTGDLAVIDRDGWVYVKGRLSSLFKVCGIQIDAERVAEDLCGFEEVAEALVVPVRDRYLGYMPVALIVPDRPWSRSLEARLMRRLASRLSQPLVELPREIVIVTALPRSPSGKVDLRAAQRHAARIARERRHRRTGSGSRLKGLWWAVRSVPLRSLALLCRRPLQAIRGLAFAARAASGSPVDEAAAADSEASSAGSVGPDRVTFLLGDRDPTLVAGLCAELSSRGLRVESAESLSEQDVEGLIVLRAKDPKSLVAAEALLDAGHQVVPCPRMLRAVRDRVTARDLLQRAGVAVPPARASTRSGIRGDAELGLPAVVKARHEHGVPVVVARTNLELEAALRSGSESQEVVVERLVEGRHGTVYFIGADSFLCWKEPFHSDISESPPTAERPSFGIQMLVERVRAATGLGFGKIDVVIDETGAAWVVDVGCFPRFRTIPHADSLLAQHLLDTAVGRWPPDSGRAA